MTYRYDVGGERLPLKAALVFVFLLSCLVLDYIVIRSGVVADPDWLMAVAGPLAGLPLGLCAAVEEPADAR